MAFGATELILIAVVVILLFGARKLPQLGKSVGRTMGEYRKGKAESELELREMDESYRRRQARQEKARRDALIDTNTDLTRVQKMAVDLGIDIRGKSEDRLLDEIEQKMSTA